MWLPMRSNLSANRLASYKRDPLLAAPHAGDPTLAQRLTEHERPNDQL